MKKIGIFLIILTSFLFACGQKYKYPGQFEIRGYKIGDKVDTILFKKHGDLYFPNYLDGWTMNNADKLPAKYKGLPISIWQLISDSNIAVTLLNDRIMNITVSQIKEAEKEKLSKMLIEKFGTDGEQKLYEENHPLQSQVTYWNLKTWETKEVIFQIGNSDMRKPGEAKPTDVHWNLVYSDFFLEGQIIHNYKKQ